ncbi:5-hydroxytryptamine receptor 3A-like [Hyperolius riggenbachi]|uniref:5-hydroxytryptamine receptor 3A-like n=1 Tax=Hyperolius riggenbachi TaxID=752182 RepID=UPI0035A398A8
MDGYNKGVRPVQNWSQVTTVTLGISIFAILGVDEKNQAITSYFWVNQSWVDEFLTWDPMKFDNVTKISIPINWIWVPDVTVIERLAAETATEIGYVYVTHNGTIFNNKPMQLVTACNLNIYYFPFDQQNCSITFSSWIHSNCDQKESPVLRCESDSAQYASHDFGYCGILHSPREWRESFIQDHPTFRLLSSPKLHIR